MRIRDLERHADLWRNRSADFDLVDHGDLGAVRNFQGRSSSLQDRHPPALVALKGRSWYKAETARIERQRLLEVVNLDHNSHLLHGHRANLDLVLRRYLGRESCAGSPHVPWPAVSDNGLEPQSRPGPQPDQRPTFDSSAYHVPLRDQFEVFLDEHRAALFHCLDGLTDAQARHRAVPSKTTLLGLVKHATFVERVWFGETIAGRSRSEQGLPATPDESFDLDEGDTIVSVRTAYAEACEESRLIASGVGLDDVVTGNRRGPLPLRWVYLHLLRELAQHCGHADIVRERLLAEVSL
jgi:hypothetical protein